MISIHLMLLFIVEQINTMFGTDIFQYISCYCLSNILCCAYRMGENFNTSHVTVYLLCPFYRQTDCVISIHLMLLFIIIPSDWSRYTTKFQYISCYCLSPNTTCSSVLSLDFNTSHVTVYHCIHLLNCWEIKISIHLMLLFIVLPDTTRADLFDFNTSHVTVYP